MAPDFEIILIKKKSNKKTKFNLKNIVQLSSSSLATSGITPIGDVSSSSSNKSSSKSTLDFVSSS